MPTLRDRVLALQQSLEAMQPEARVNWRLGQIANVLIEQTKEQAQHDPVLAVVEPFEPDEQSMTLATRSGDMRAVLGQLLLALPPGPSGASSGVQPWRS